MPTIEFPVTNVHAINSPDKTTIDAVLHFVTEMGKRGEYSANTARLLNNAVTQLVSILADDESRNPLNLLPMVEDLGRRWGVRNSAKPETIATYVQRSRRALTDFIAYQEDPASFRGTKRAPKGKDRRPSEEEKKPLRTTAPALPPAPSANSKVAADEVRTFPLPDGRSIKFSIPLDVKRDELAKYMLHILPLAVDFSPDDVQLFRMSER
ncbi:MAG: hypothetical protein H6708_13755 [Kofleriaceae bacterium]|nr:hypothetical protein [Kofleriaceae bacterium]